MTKKQLKYARTLAMKIDDAQDEISGEAILNREALARTLAKLQARWDAMPSGVQLAARRANYQNINITKK